VSVSQLWLYVQIDKGTEQVEYQHEGKPESTLGDRMMPIHMVGMPRGHHLVYGLVLNEPSVMSKTYDRLSACLSWR